MPVQVSYMGTKRQLAPTIAEIIRVGADGPLLDLFSGICAVSCAVAPRRQIWCNDAQIFASTAARAFFTFSEPPLHAAADIVQEHYADNRNALNERFKHYLEEERTCLRSDNVKRLQELEAYIPSVSSSTVLEGERRRLAQHDAAVPYRLFSITYAGGYLGLQQCIDLDSLRYAFDHLAMTHQLSDEQHTWMCLALCQTLSKCSTTTGHFAQFLRAKETTQKRFVAQRRRRIWSEWLSALSEFAPLGTTGWRSRNSVFQEDALALLETLTEAKKPPRVIYADPPYTDDQYSRYYHLYETLLLYDYPPSDSVGRYRPGRFSSLFSLKSKVHETIETMIARCADLGCRLILTYPENGLLPDSKTVLLSLLRRHYGSDVSTVPLDHLHSSLGGSKGYQKLKVTEVIYVAGPL